MRPSLPFFSFFLVLALAPANSVAVPQGSVQARDPVLDAFAKADRAGRVAQAGKILRRAIHNAEQSEPLSPRLAIYLDALANLRDDEKKFDRKKVPEAIALEERALAIDEDAFGLSDRTVEEDLSALGQFLRLQGNRDEAERTLKRALAIARTNRDVDEIERFGILMQLGWLYMEEARWTEAEQPMREVQQGCTDALKKYGPCLSVADDLPKLYRREGRTSE